MTVPSIQEEIPTVDELVINWHITEACNYSCTYCYAKWENAVGKHDIARDMETARALLTAVRTFFDPGNADNPLRNRLRWRGLRLSIAGGEPMLYGNKIVPIMQIAKELGMTVSLITNGSLLPENMIPLASILSVLGVSVDSALPETSQRIGRIDRRGTLSLDTIAHKLDMARAANPALQIKINTVVNALNKHEDMHAMVERLKPSRWKLLRVLPLVDASLSITTDEFSAFVRRHKNCAAELAPEDNQVMTESYIMIDPLGQFFQNAPDQQLRPYRYSAPILEAGVPAAFAAICFSPAAFAGRYQSFVRDEL
jgi:radical S-adenosyl methionine domain-containing protein 2